MCHPDISSLVTFSWDTAPKPRANGTKTLHSCVNWDMLVASMQSRLVGREEMDALANPHSDSSKTSQVEDTFD